MSASPDNVRRTLQRWGRRARGWVADWLGSDDPCSPRRLARLLPLEERSLLSATPVGPEVRVNTLTAGAQETFAEARRAVATDAAGNSVMVWASNGQDGDSWGV